MNEDYFLLGIRSCIYELIDYNIKQMVAYSPKAAKTEDVVNEFYSSIAANKSDIFAFIPEVNTPPWSKEGLRQFRRYGYKYHDDEPWKHWAWFKLHGTTNSGDWRSTTMGNTLRQMHWQRTCIRILWP